MILPMAKVQVVGPRRFLEGTLEALQREGVLQIRSLLAPPGVALATVPLSAEQAAQTKTLRDRLQRIDSLIAALSKPGGESHATLPDIVSDEFPEQIGELERDFRSLNSRSRDLEEERDLVTRYERLLTAMAPIRPAIEGLGVETIGLILRRDRPEALTLLRQEVRRIAGDRFELIARDIDHDSLAVLIAIPKANAAELSRLLFERGVAEIKLPGRYANQPLIGALALLLRRTRELPEEIRAASSLIDRFCQDWRDPLERARRAAVDRIDQMDAIGRCNETRHTFVVAGWVPRRQLSALEVALGTAFARSVSVIEVAFDAFKEEDVPVVLENRPWLRPFEILLSLVPLPRYGTIDPTIFLAIFFPIFFGLMLGDVGFGIAGLLLAGVVRWRGRARPFLRDAAVVAVWCSVSSILFGLLFGEFFGQLGEVVGLRPWILDRRLATLKFLGIAVGVGAVHIVLGMCVGVYASMRAGHRKEAAERVLRLALLFAASTGIAVLAGWLPRGLGVPLVAGIVVMVGASMVLGSVLAPLELVLSLGNILSYARLMALGLASVMLADVANRMPGLFHPAAAGIVLAVFLHAVNFALALLSPTVCALRLHYVEFFEKFFEGGGRPFRPLALNV